MFFLLPLLRWYYIVAIRLPAPMEDTSNLFNRYPDKTNSDLLAVYRAAKNTAATEIYPSFSPFGINGGYYYGRMVYSF